DLGNIISTECPISPTIVWVLRKVSVVTGRSSRRTSLRGPSVEDSLVIVKIQVSAQIWTDDCFLLCVSRQEIKTMAVALLNPKLEGIIRAGAVSIEIIENGRILRVTL